MLTVSIDKTDRIDIVKFFNILDIDLNEIFNNLRYPEFLKQVINEETQDKAILHEDSLEIQELFDNRIFNEKYYDLGKVGRYRLNKRFNLNLPEHLTNLTIKDIVGIVDALITLTYSNTNLGYREGNIDDIDHLQNRRVRSVGELLQTQFRSGLIRLERILTERMTICDTKILKVTTLVNPKPIISMMREFFGSSQLSQFLDQTNPLAELTHRRRISGLGPGGFSRDHVSFTVYVWQAKDFFF